jgi:hypothetical protein
MTIRGLFLMIAVFGLPATSQCADRILPQEWNAKKAADMVMAGLRNVCTPQVKGAHDSDFTVVKGRAYIVYMANDKQPGEAPTWPFIYAALSVVDLKTLDVEKVVTFAASEQVCDDTTLPVGACFVPRILRLNDRVLRCFFASEQPGKRQSQTWYRDFDVERSAFEAKVNKAKLKTQEGVLDMQPAPFYRDAAAHGFTGPAKDYGLYQIDSFKQFDGRTYCVLNNFAVCQNALAVLNDAHDTFEVLGHFNQPPSLRLSEASVNRRPDGTWLAICRQESGTHNYTFTHSKDGRTWAANEYGDVVQGGSSSKPSFDRFKGVYYLGWQEATRINRVGRSVFNVEVSRDCMHWERKYRFETERSFQYPVFREAAGTVWLTVTQGNSDSSRKERIMFGKLE